MDKLNEFMEPVKAAHQSLIEIPLLGPLLQVIVVLFFAVLLMRFGKYALKSSFAKQGAKLKHNKGKVQTLESLSMSVWRYAVYFIAILGLLPIFNVPISSVIASAGIVGVAIGFGAQSLVKDVITGFFILFEDQYSVGDYIETAGISGQVVEVGLRITRLQDFSGVIHVIPNGEIQVVSNHSRSSTRALVDIGVSYDADVNQVESILAALCAEIALELDVIVEGPTVLGVQELGDSAVVFRILARTKPLEQWGVERLIRKRAKLKLDEMGIGIPYPHRVVLVSKEDEQDDRA